MIRVILALLAAATLPAQTTQRVVPVNRTTQDGLIASSMPWGLVAGRVQQVFEGNSIARNIATIQSFAHRRDASRSTNFPGRRIANLKVSFGHTNTRPSTMATTFARNRVGAQTTVFQGALALPAQSGRGVGPFNIIVKLTKPFVYTPARGNLLVEFELPGRAGNRFVFYPIDGDKGPITPGSARPFGTGGAFLSGDTYSVTSPVRTLHQGGFATVSASGLKRAYAAIASFGISNRQWGAFRLPLDLTGAGARGNHVYASMDVVLPLALTTNGTTFSGSSALPIPNDRSVWGMQLFGQAVFADPVSNRLGFVFSNGVAMTIAAGVPVPFQTVWHGDPARATGAFLIRGSLSGPVTQFSGTFR